MGRVGEVQNDQFEHAHAAGDVGQHHGHLGHEITGQEIKEADAHVAGQQHVHAGRGGNDVHPGHDELGHGDVRCGKDEFLAENMHRLAHRETEHQIGAGDHKQNHAQNAYIRNGHVPQQLVGNHRRGDHEDDPAQAQRAHPEGHGQHEHQTHDVRQGKTPGRIETVAHAGAAQQRAEIIADGLAHKGNQGHARQGQLLVDGFERQPVIAHQDHIIDDHENQREADTAIGNLQDALSDLGDAVGFEFIIQKIDRQQKNGGDQNGPQVTQVFFHGMP